MILISSKTSYLQLSFNLCAVCKITCASLENVLQLCLLGDICLIQISITEILLIKC